MGARGYKVPKGYELEHFMLNSGDYTSCTEPIREAFSESYKNEGATFFLTPETFEITFGSPIIKRNLFLRVRHLESDSIVGFLGAVPRTLKFPDGNTYEYYVGSGLSVKTKHQKLGIADCMVRKALEIFKELNYEGMYGFFEALGKKIVKRVLGNDLKHVYMIEKFVARVLDVDEVSKTVKFKWYEKMYLRFKSRLKKRQMDDIRILEYGDIPKLYELSKDFERRNDISVVRDWKDFEWYVKLPYVITVVHDGKDGSPDGFISSWPFELAGFGSTCNMGMIDMIHIYNLDTSVASDLAAKLCLVANEMGWAGLQTPFVPYFSAKPFLKSGFIMFPKSVEVMMVSLRGHDIPKVNSLYLDFR